MVPRLGKSAGPNWRYRLHLFAALILLILIFVPVSAVTNSVTIDGDVVAAGDWDDEVCVTDEGGVDDQPGQKDLNQLCAASNFATVMPANTLYIMWHWDNNGYPGNNTGDGCALFDTDADSGIDHALCITIETSPDSAPATIKETRFLSCDDSKTDRCAGSSSKSFTGNSALDTDVPDPFAGDVSHTSGDCAGTNCNLIDVAVEVSIPMSDFGVPAGNIVLGNVCSFPSQIPNSDPSDCVLEGAPFSRISVDTSTGNNQPTGLTPPEPDLAIDKSHSGDFTVGTNGTYTLLVSNVGAADTSGTITVTDTLPTGLTFVSGTGTGWSCSAIGQNVTCSNAGPISAPGSSTITLTVSVSSSAFPSVTNTASVSTSGDTNTANNSDSDPTTVNAAPQPPVAVDDSASTPPDTAVSVPVLSNDSDPNGDPLTLQSVGTPSQGSVSFSPDGTVIYTPNSGASGTDTFTYTVCDPGGLCDTATVTITISNAAPTANGDSATTPTDTPVSIPVLANDTDPNGDTLEINSVTQPSNGSVSFTPDGTLIYTPDPGFAGTDSFTYEACDPGGLCDTATVIVTVNNAAPLANADSVSTQVGTTVTIPVLNNDADPNGDTLSVVSISQPANGSATLNPDGTVSYTPNGGFTGTDVLTYTICDPGGLCDIATVTITVNDDSPTAVSETVTTSLDKSVVIDVLANDTDPNNSPLTIASVTQPANGTVTINPDGTITFTPNPGFTGIDSFSYTICNNLGLCDTAIDVAITVLSGAGGTGMDAIMQVDVVLQDPLIRYSVSFLNFTNTASDDNPGPEYEAQLPTGVSLLPDTLAANSGVLTFDSASRTLFWNGSIGANKDIIIQYTVQFDSDGTIITSASSGYSVYALLLLSGIGVAILMSFWPQGRSLLRKRARRLAVVLLLILPLLAITSCTDFIQTKSAAVPICHQGFFHFDSDGDRVNDLTIPTDDPTTRIEGDPTCIKIAPRIPTP